jgi:hypothetical protein
MTAFSISARAMLGKYKGLLRKFIQASFFTGFNYFIGTLNTIISKMSASIKIKLLQCIFEIIFDYAADCSFN